MCYPDSTNSDVIESLSDDAWINIHYHLSALGEAIEKDLGRKPTSKEFFEILSWALGHTTAELFEDVAPGSLSKLTAKFHAERRKIDPGTVIAIPGRNAQWYPVLYLTSNRFGDAFGTFPENKLPELPLKTNQSPAGGRVIYSMLKSVRKGQWRILGSRPDLLRCFPKDPEIYHSKTHYNLENPKIGKFGSAESPNGDLRDIDEAEAKSVGLLDGTYESALIGDEVANYLEKQRV
jgi:hypothetical protein